MDYLEYKRLVDEKRARLKLPRDCREFLPLKCEFTSLYVWTVEWVLKFEDRKYLRLREHYTKRAGLMDSRRKLFAFHYGDIVAEDANGTPEYRSDGPVDIRIDNVHDGSAHLHYGSAHPHYQQESVRGLNLSGVEMFPFFDAILRHRKSHRPLDDVLHFRLSRTL